MKLAVASMVAATALFCGAALAATTSSTRTNVCHKSFCGNVTVEHNTSPPAVFTTLTITSWPRFKAVDPGHAFVQLRCANGSQVKGTSIRCPGRGAIGVQRCWKHNIGPSNCHAWVSFR